MDAAQKITCQVLEKKVGLVLKANTNIELVMAVEKQGFSRRNWKRIVYYSIIFSTFIAITFWVYLQEINHLIENDTANFINNVTYITYFTLIFLEPFSRDKKRAYLVRKTTPFVIPIFAVSLGLLYLDYNLVINKTINEIEYLNQYTIILVAYFLCYILVYGLFWIQDWRRERKNNYLNNTIPPSIPPPPRHRA